jgi:hypothetical protein
MKVVHLFDMGADEKRQLLGEQVGEVDDGLAVSRNTAQHQDLGPVVLGSIL